jgi:hypothetical protein
MDPSLASQTLASLEALTVQVSEGLQEWSWVVFTAFTVFTVLTGYAKEAAKGNLLPTAFFGEQTVHKFIAGSLMIGYFALAMPFMEVVREAGMTLSGSDQGTVPIGEIFRQADTVTERINATIDSFQSLGWMDQLKAIPQLMSLRIMGWFVHVIYIFIALISFWVYAKFLMGYMVGGFFIGGVSGETTEHLGKQSYFYVIKSTLPLFLLAVLQGYSANLLNSTVTPSGIIKTAEIWAIMWTQLIVLFLCIVAAMVPTEWMSGIASMSGAPSLSSLPRTMGGMGGSVINALRSSTSSRNSISSSSSGGGGSLPSPASGGGGGRANGVPMLTFNPSRRTP